MNKQKIVAFFISISMLMPLLPSHIVLAEDTPDLNSDNYYELSSADDLYWFMEYVNSGNTSANAVLTEDITVNENLLDSLVYDENKAVTNGDSFKEWFPVGYEYDRDGDGTSEKVYYSGVFDGQGHTISGLYFSSDEQVCAGLFGFLAEGAEIKNVNISDTYLYSPGYIGGIAGDSDKGRIRNCTFDGKITGAGYLGGICGYSRPYSLVMNCTNYGKIYGLTNVNTEVIGGIVGWNNGLISECHNNGNVSGVMYIGGISGESYGNMSMTEYSSNSGAVSGYGYVGGISGYHHGSSTINQCYNSGDVVCTEAYAGGIAGEFSFAYIRSSHNVASVTGPYYIGAISGISDDRISLANNYYLSGCAVAGDSDIQNGTGSEDNTPVEDIDGKINSASAEEFTSGTVAYYLNNHSIGAQVWKQNLDNGKESDAFPKLVGGGVYPDTDGSYTNYCKFIDVENGFFKDEYGAMYYEPAVWNEEKEHYEISNAGQLYWFMEYSNRYFSYITIAQNSADHLNAAMADAVLTKDIVVNKNLLDNIEYGSGNAILNDNDFIKWTPIGRRFLFSAPSGYTVNMMIHYNGSFDGQGHTISGLYLNDSEELLGGMFGYGASLYLQNLGVEDSYINSAESGGICGRLDSGRFENCYFIGVVKGTSAAGGLLGNNGYSQYHGGTIRDCYSTADVTGDTYTGAICGNNHGTYAEYKNCYYLSGKAYGGGKKQNGLGSETNTAVSDTDSGITSKTASQFASGEVTYLLNNSSGTDTGIWHQNLDNETTPDKYPKFKGASVYRIENNGSVSYSNVNNNYTDEDTDDENDNTYEAVTYEISNADELYEFMERVNAGGGYANAVLTNDIVVNEKIEYNSFGDVTNAEDLREWFPIGYVYDRNGDRQTEFVDFKGTFDGQGHTISGLYFNNMSQSYVALFGSTSCDAVIKNVTVADSYFKNNGSVSAICATNYGLVENCHNKSRVVAQNYVGGICYSNSGIIKNCTNSSDISGSGFLGGICVHSIDAVITGCTNTGNITATSSSVSGIVTITYGGVVENCINSGSISAKTGAGGICCSNTGTVKNCYNTGGVNADSHVGAICDGNSGTVENSYYLADEETDSLDGTTAKTEAEFASGEVTYLLNNGTDEIFSVWHQNIDNGEEADLYPVFDGGKVYRTGEEGNYTYSNTNSSKPEYVYDENGFFGENIYEPAVWNDDKNCYEIYNAGQLYWFSEYASNVNPSANAQLCANITVNKDLLDSLETDENENVLNGESFRQWLPIARYNGYKGTFNGMGYTISGLYYNSMQSYVGLFGRCEAGAQIKNVNISDSYLRGRSMLGSICGYSNAPITNCDYYGETSSSTYGGGICGYINKALISGCTNYGAILGDRMGGICGFSGEFNKVTDCTNRGEIVGSGSEIGGIVGTNEGIIENCSNRADVSVRKLIYNMGGICGDNCGIVRNCYNSGDIIGSNWGVGGIIGTNSSGLVENCSNDGAISGHTYIGGICGQNGGTVKKSSNSGGVIGDFTIGGISGLNYGGFIKDCGNTGAVKGEYSIGGICGYNENGSTKTARLANCYNTGIVTGTDYNVGSVCGLDEGAIRNCYYLENSAKADGTIQNGIGTEDNSLYIDIKIVVLSKSREAFSSGEITYLLNGSVTDTSNIWHQDIDNGNIPDDYPVFAGGKVYRIEEDGIYVYSNMGDVAAEEDNNTVIDYEISNADELYEFMEYVNTGNPGSDSVNAVLTADIVINNIEYDSDGNIANADLLREWFPVGYNYDRKNDGKKEIIIYNGIFDGKGYSITGLYFDNANQDYVGLFGNIGSGAVIKNVNIVDSYINGKSYFGGICGLSSGEIKNCSADGIIKGEGFGGGIVGASYDGLITRCHNNAEVKGSGQSIGGICGYADNISIENCYNLGKISSNAHNTGGICGYNFTGTIKNSFNQGKVFANDSSVGGLCGYNSGEIRSSYNTGAVKGDFYTGGIAGNNIGKTINCYYFESCALGGVFKQNGTGSEFNVPVRDIDSQTVAKAENAFTSGEVTYLLNNGITSGRQIWYQTIGESDFPVYNGETVYFSESSQPQYFNKVASVMSYEGNIKIDGTEISANNIDSDCVLIIAFYSKNTMLGIEIMNISEDTSVDITDLDTKNADTLKVMLWNNLDECIPVCKSEYAILN